MRPGQNKRMRGRNNNNNNNNNNRKGPNPLTRSYESNGPDVKIRGTAHHIGEKYLQLARDAQTSGDPVMAESYLQHAEHYFRLIAAAQLAQQQPPPGYPRQPGDAEDDVEDDDDLIVPDRFSSPLERFTPPAPPPPAFQPPHNPPQPQFGERPYYNNGDRQPQGYDRQQDRSERQDRPERQERPERQDRGPRPERPYNERPYQDRPYGDRQAQNREHEPRGPRPPRPNRDFRNEGASRPERIAPVEALEDKGLPAFITAPVRIPGDVNLGSETSAEPLGSPMPDQPELENEGTGFHLRPRRRRRKPEGAPEQGLASEPTHDPVGD